MGFGQKTDYSTSRTLDLDKTYRHVIQPAAEAAGLVCVRADDLMHAGLPIDKPVFENLLWSDVVVADLSTYNANALYQFSMARTAPENDDPDGRAAVPASCDRGTANPVV